MNQTSIIPNWCRLALLACVLAVVALLWARHHFGLAEYERRIAALQAAGEPVTASDFAARYPDPPPERQFRRLLRSGLPAGSNPAVAGPIGDVWAVWERVRALTNREPFAPELLEQARLVLASNAAPVELLLRTDLADFGLLHQWQTKGFALDGDSIFRRIMLCRTLALQTTYEAEVGHPQRTATALVRGFQVARLPSHETMFSAIGQLAGERITLRALDRTLNRARLTDDDLRRLDKALPRPSDLMREAMLTERAYQIYWWNDPAASSLALEGVSVANPTLKHAQDQVGCLLRGYGGRLQLLDRWAGRVAASRLPMREQLAAIAASQSWLPQMSANRTNLADRVRRCWDADYVLLGLTEPKVIPLFNDNAIDLAGLANAQAAVAIERWRLAHPGRLPDTLSELVPAYLTAVPLDPYDGQPVRYKKLPVGYVVYSVGTGWTDQGERSSSAITLTVER